MSFLKRLLKSSEKRKNKEDKTSQGSRSRSASCSSQSNTSSPAQSPRHKPTGQNVTTVGFRTPTNKNVAQVLPGLLLGTAEIAGDLNALERYKVTHILNVTEEVDCSYPSKFIYKRISIPDRPSTNIYQYFEECVCYIDEARKNKGCVLVHCFYGESRAATIVISYLIKTEKMKHREALGYLQLLRPGVHPNQGFSRQLDDFEEKELSKRLPLPYRSTKESTPERNA